MDLHDAEYVLEIAQYKNITKAAEALNISQPTLSVFLKRLENDLNFQIFIRDGKSLIPTLEGQLYLNACQKIISIRNQAYDQIYNSKKGHINLGIVNSKTSQLCDAIMEFKKDHPDYTISPFIQSSNELYKKILDGGIDFAFATSYIEDPEEIYPNISIKKINSYELNLYVSKEYTELIQSTEGPKHIITRKTCQLLNEFSYSYSKLPMVHERIFNELFATYHLNPRYLSETNVDNISFAITLLLLENKFSILPETKIPKDIAKLQFPSHPKVYTVLLQQKNKLLNSYQQEFIQILTKHIKEEKYYYK